MAARAAGSAWPRPGSCRTSPGSSRTCRSCATSRASTTLVDTNPYGEIVRYLKAHRDHTEQALRTLSYFDGAVLARSAKAPALFSVGLMDDICPPSTVYAAFNAYGGPKEIREYPYNEHEGGQGFHDRVKLRWLAERVARLTGQSRWKISSSRWWKPVAGSVSGSIRAAISACQRSLTGAAAIDERNAAKSSTSR